MEALVKPLQYFESSILDDEKKKVFEKCWMYVGIKDDYKNINDFRTFMIGNTPIVVQNMKGTIKAFRNVCSHRHSIIQVSKHGNRPLMCPYHGWAYNHTGKPIGIPKKPFFNFEKTDLECLKLSEFPIEYCGNLIFTKINFKDSSTDLKSYLGEFYQELEIASLQFDEKVDENTMQIQANWKILVENTLESYHVQLVHNETFQKLGAKGLDFQFSDLHSKWQAELELKEDEGKQAKINLNFKERKFKIPGYNHILIFPNMLFSTTYGISFNISVIQPNCSKSSEFVSNVFLSQGEDASISSFYKASLRDFNRKVFDEDKEVCEYVQQGVKSSPFPGQLSEEEKRVQHFQENYLKLMQQNEE